MIYKNILGPLYFYFLISVKFFKYNYLFSTIYKLPDSAVNAKPTLVPPYCLNNC